MKQPPSAKEEEARIDRLLSSITSDEPIQMYHDRAVSVAKDMNRANSEKELHNALWSAQNELDFAYSTYRDMLKANPLPDDTDFLKLQSIVDGLEKITITYEHYVHI